MVHDVFNPFFVYYPFSVARVGLLVISSHSAVMVAYKKIKIWDEGIERDK